MNGMQFKSSFRRDEISVLSTVWAASAALEHLRDTKAPPENDQKNITELCDKFEKSINYQPKTLALQM